MEGLPGDPLCRCRSGGQPGRPRGRRVLTGLTRAAAPGRQILLWRHGRTAWNVDGRFQGQLDPPLDAVGRGQAQDAAQALVGRAPDLLLSSDSCRAASTATGLARLAGLDSVLDLALREIDLGRWQGLTREQVQASYPAEYDEWLTGDDVRRGGGETFAEVGQRAVARLEAALVDVPPGGLLVACTHGGTTRAVLGVLLETGPAHWWRLGPLGNARWSTAVETARGWRLAEHNAGVEEAESAPAHAVDGEPTEGEQPVEAAAQGRAAQVL